MQANYVVDDFLGKKVLHISQNTALMYRWEINKKKKYYSYD